jgi:SAM-dependent methyltransferase
LAEASETDNQQWERRYGEPGYAYGTQPNAFMAAQRPLIRRGMRALVPADGEGRNGVWLAEQGCDVVTFDRSTAGPEKARRLAAERGVQIDARSGDLATWSWPVAEFDLVVSVFVHLLPSRRPQVHAAYLGALKPGGLVILEAFRPAHAEFQKAGTVGGPPSPERMFTAAMLRQDFAAAEIVLLEETETMLDEGGHHVGRSAVVRLIARRPA